MTRKSACTRLMWHPQRLLTARHPTLRSAWPADTAAWSLTSESLSPSARKFLRALFVSRACWLPQHPLITSWGWTHMSCQCCCYVLTKTMHHGHCIAVCHCAYGSFCNAPESQHSWPPCRFNVYVAQPEVKPGCVLRRSNVRVLESRKLVTNDEVRAGYPYHGCRHDASCYYALHGYSSLSCCGSNEVIIMIAHAGAKLQTEHEHLCLRWGSG